MFYTRADFRFRIVGPPRRFVHSAAFRLLAMDVADEAILGQECLVGCRSVGGIGPHPARRVLLLSSKPKGRALSAFADAQDRDDAQRVVDQMPLNIELSRD
jgi:hypothetical protein